MNQAETVLTEIAERDNNLYRIYFEANPIPQEQRKAGFGGINRYKDLEGFDNSKLIISSNKRIDILTKQIVVQSKSLDEIAALATEKEALLKSIPAIYRIMKLLDISNINVNNAINLFPVLKTFVAPILPDPIFLISPYPEIFTIIRPKGIEPIIKPKNKYIIMF